MKLAGFSKKIKFVPEFNKNREQPAADQFNVEIQPVEMGTLLTMMDAFERMGVAGEVDTEKLGTDTIKTMLEQFGTLLPEHCKIVGLKDADDNEITTDDVVRFGPLMPLAMELLLQLSQISSPSEDAEKNSETAPA